MDPSAFIKVSFTASPTGGDSYVWDFDVDSADPRSDLLTANSTDTLDIVAGPTGFMLDKMDLNYDIGCRVRLTYGPVVGNYAWMEGNITGYTGSTAYMAVNIDSINDDIGLGPYSSWVLTEGVTYTGDPAQYTAKHVYGAGGEYRIKIIYTKTGCPPVTTYKTICTAFSSIFDYDCNGGSLTVNFTPEVHGSKSTTTKYFYFDFDDGTRLGATGIASPYDAVSHTYDTVLPTEPEVGEKYNVTMASKEGGWVDTFTASGVDDTFLTTYNLTEDSLTVLMGEDLDTLGVCSGGYTAIAGGNSIVFAVAPTASYKIQAIYIDDAATATGTDVYSKAIQLASPTVTALNVYPLDEYDPLPEDGVSSFTWCYDVPLCLALTTCPSDTCAYTWDFDTTDTFIESSTGVAPTDPPLSYITNVLGPTSGWADPCGPTDFTMYWYTVSGAGTTGPCVTYHCTAQTFYPCGLPVEVGPGGDEWYRLDGLAAVKVGGGLIYVFNKTDGGLFYIEHCSPAPHACHTYAGIPVYINAMGPLSLYSDSTSITVWSGPIWTSHGIVDKALVRWNTSYCYQGWYTAGGSYGSDPECVVQSVAPYIAVKMHDSGLYYHIKGSPEVRCVPEGGSVVGCGSEGCYYEVDGDLLVPILASDLPYETRTVDDEPSSWTSQNPATLWGLADCMYLPYFCGQSPPNPYTGEWLLVDSGLDISCDTKYPKIRVDADCGSKTGEFSSIITVQEPTTTVINASGVEGSTYRLVTNNPLSIGNIFVKEGTGFSSDFDVVLGQDLGTGYSYSWSPATYLDNNTGATASVTDVEEDFVDYTVIANPVASGSCVRTSIDCNTVVGTVTVAKPTCTLTGVSLSSGDGGTCSKLINVAVGSVTPKVTGLAFILEAVGGNSTFDANTYLSDDDIILPQPLDASVSPCSYVIINNPAPTADIYGGICLLANTADRAFDSGNNRIAYQVTEDTTFPLTLEYQDLLCSEGTTSFVTHSYRLRLLDVMKDSDGNDLAPEDVTEVMIVGNELPTVAISGGTICTFEDVSGCVGSVLIDPLSGTYTYPAVAVFSSVINGTVFSPTYSWDFDVDHAFTGSYSYSAINSTTATPTVTYTGPSVGAVTKTAKVQLTVTSHFGSNTSTIKSPVASLVIGAGPVPCSTSITVTPSTTSGSEPLTVTFSLAHATSGDCTGITTPTWLINYGDGTTGSATGINSSVSHTYTDNGTYGWSATASVTVDSVPMTASASGTITVGAICEMTCSAVANAYTGHGYPTGTYRFVGTVTQSNCTELPTYTWDFGDGTTVSTGGLALAIHSYSTSRPATYNWTMTANADGSTCDATGSVTISGSGGPGSPIPTFSASSPVKTDCSSGKCYQTIGCSVSYAVPMALSYRFTMEIYSTGGTRLYTVEKDDSRGAGSTTTLTASFVYPDDFNPALDACGTYRYNYYVTARSLTGGDPFDTVMGELSHTFVTC